MAHLLYMGEIIINNVPKDSGVYHSSLTNLLARIPDSADRYIGCGPGWYEILSTLEEKISTVDPLCTISYIREIDGRLVIDIDSCSKGSEAAIRAAIALASRQSELHCEFTGRPGVLMHRDGNLRTLSPIKAPIGYQLVQTQSFDLQISHLFLVLSDLLDELNIYRNKSK
jgi:hypothetical protein